MKIILGALFSIVFFSGYLLGGEIDPDFKLKLDKLQENDIIQIIVVLS